MVPVHVCVQSYLDAVDRFDKHSAQSPNSLKKILFVDISREKLAALRRDMG
jgi:hypothetical protein